MGRLLEFMPAGEVRPAAHPLGRPSGCTTGVLISPTEFVGRALEFIDTDFGRLVQLGSFRDSQSYQAAISELPFDRKALGKAVAQWQEEAFRSWAARDLKARIDDLLNYCRLVGRAAPKIIAGWIVRADYSTLIPSEVQQNQRVAFCRNVAVVPELPYPLLCTIRTPCGGLLRSLLYFSTE